MNHVRALLTAIETARNVPNFDALSLGDSIPAGDLENAIWSLPGVKVALEFDKSPVTPPPFVARDTFSVSQMFEPDGGEDEGDPKLALNLSDSRLEEIQDGAPLTVEERAVYETWYWESGVQDDSSHFTVWRLLAGETCDGWCYLIGEYFYGASVSDLFWFAGPFASRDAVVDALLSSPFYLANHTGKEITFTEWPDRDLYERLVACL